jgi:hypothetical protein
VVRPASTPKVEQFEVSAYTVPTKTPEADGALAWHETTLVLVRTVACGVTAFGYSFADVATANFIDAHLKTIVVGGDCLNISELWVAEIRLPDMEKYKTYGNVNS